jgi:hypothetical protein
VHRNLELLDLISTCCPILHSGRTSQNTDIPARKGKDASEVIYQFRGLNKIRVSRGKGPQGKYNIFFVMSGSFSKAREAEDRRVNDVDMLSRSVSKPLARKEGGRKGSIG